MANYQTTNEVHYAGLLVWAINSKGNRYDVQEINPHPERQQVTVRIGVHVRKPCICFHIYWRALKDPEHESVCQVSMFPANGEPASMRYRFMGRAAEQVYSTGYSNTTSGEMLRAKSTEQLYSLGPTLIATVRLDFRQLKNNLPTESILRLQTLNQRFGLRSLDDMDGGQRSVLDNELPYTTFVLEFHCANANMAHGTILAAIAGKRKRGEGSDSVGHDAEPSIIAHKRTQVTLSERMSTRNPSSCTLLHNQATLPSSEDGRAADPQPQALTSIRSKRTGSIDTVQALRAANAEEAALEKEAEKTLKEKSMRIELLRQVLAES
ncbi:hypothetical protein NLJ89_g483 [Agrocybe chaxingu]|uniref:Uncharacterized protein n=1 Tax=Agrocybe chaxingu TaxID=84603 RepID=A0A9W8N1T3_9AGAR|nr:hypothetical protein NLJ89_g483 [Agrocybe chaxingu]